MPIKTPLRKMINRFITMRRASSNTVTTQALGRNLMTTTEIEQMKNENCIVFIRSMKPFMDKKYPLEKHPNYKKSGDYSDKNLYIPRRMIRLKRGVLKSLEVYRCDEEEYVHPKYMDKYQDEWDADSDDFAGSESVENKENSEDIEDVLN